MSNLHLRSIEPLIAIVLGGVCGSAAIAALLGRFLPRLGLLVATQAAFFVRTPSVLRVLWGTEQSAGTALRPARNVFEILCIDLNLCRSAHNGGAPMGHKQTSNGKCLMSASAPRAEIIS